MLDLRRGDVGEEVAFLDIVADVDVALVDIAAGAREDIRLGKCRRGGRQGDDHSRIAWLDGGDAELRHIVFMLLCGGHNLLVLRLISPGAETKTGKQGKQRAEAEPLPLP
jgi:hypothetical protein